MPGGDSPVKPIGPPTTPILGLVSRLHPFPATEFRASILVNFGREISIPKKKDGEQSEGPRPSFATLTL